MLHASMGLPTFNASQHVQGSALRPLYFTTASWWRNEIDYLAPPPSRDEHASDSYIGSPSIVDTGGGWLASHDRFFHEAKGTTYVFGASSPSATWELKAAVSPMYWAQLFVNDGVPNAAVYLIGTSDDMSGHGDIVISRCLRTGTELCSGERWSEPTILFAGNSTTKFHCAPTPVVRAYEGRAEAGHTLKLLRAFDMLVLPNEMVVVMLDAYAYCADLTQASCWHMSSGLSYDPSWLPLGDTQSGSRRFGGALQWEEAGAIVDAAGNVTVMVRIDGDLAGCADLSSCNRAVLLSYDMGARALAFRAVVPFPSGSNKFKVARHDGAGAHRRIAGRDDDVAGRMIASGRQQPGGREDDVAASNQFYALTNPVTQVPAAQFAPGAAQRSLLMLAHSTDLLSWHACAPVAFDDTNKTLLDSLALTGLQYVDWTFSGPDIIAAVRASYRGAVTYHDANRLLVTRVERFVELCETVVSGSGFSLHVLWDGLPAFANREYLWMNVPEPLRGMSVARTLGGAAVPARMTIEGARSQLVYVGLCVGLPGHLPPAGWQATNWTFAYSDAARTQMTLFSRHLVQVGQKIAVPNDRTWCGAPLFYWPRPNPRPGRLLGGDAMNRSSLRTSP